MSNYVLVINPGSTSTKFGVFEKNTKLYQENISHTQDELQKLSLIDQINFRQKIIAKKLIDQKINPKDIKLVMARGGLLKPLQSGTYFVNQAMLSDLGKETYGSHAANLGALIAHEFAIKWKIKAYIHNPVVVDEMWTIARITGVKGIRRKSHFHALNQKRSALLVAQELKKSYNTSNFIVAHLGGGISIGCHSFGKVVDVNNALDGEGPFSIQRAGTLPTVDIIKMCFSKKYQEEELKTLLFKKSGLYSYFNDISFQDLILRVDFDDEVRLIVDTMLYQVAKMITSYGATLKGHVDAIILTGGLAYSQYITETLSDYVSWLGPVKIIAGENEMLALSEAGNRIIEKQEEVQDY